MYEERDGGGSPDPTGWDDLSYYEKKTLRNAEMIDLWVRPFEKLWKWLKGRERWMRLPRWISVWVVLSLAGAIIAGIMDYHVVSLYLAIAFILSFAVFLYLCITHR